MKPPRRLENIERPWPNQKSVEPTVGKYQKLTGRLKQCVGGGAIVLFLLYIRRLFALSID